ARSVVGPRCRPARRSRKAQDSALIAAGRFVVLERGAVLDVLHAFEAIPVEDAAAGQDRRADRPRLAWSSCRSRGAVSGLSVDSVGGTVGAGFDEERVEGADLSRRGRDRCRRQVRRDSDQEDEDGERKKGQPAPHSYPTRQRRDAREIDRLAGSSESRIRGMNPASGMLNFASSNERVDSGGRAAKNLRRGGGGSRADLPRL